MGGCIRTVCSWVVCTAASLALGTPAHALPKSTASAASTSSPAEPPAHAPPQVEIAIVGDAPNADALGARIVSWFHGDAGHAHASTQKSLDSSTVFAPTADPGVRVWVLIRSASSARLFFAVEEQPSAPPRYLVNDLALDSGLDELGMEQMAQVVYLSAMALWAGNVESTRGEVEEGLREARSHTQAPPSPQAPLAPTVVPEAPPTATDRGRLSFRLGLEAGMRGGVGDALLWRAGLSLAVLRLRDSSIVGAQLHVDDVAPSAVSRSALKLAFSEQSVRLGLLAESRTSRRVWRIFELGPGVDVVHYRATSVTDPSLVPTAGGTNVIPTIFGCVASRWTLGDFSLQAGVVLVVQLERTHYDIGGPDGRSTILTPWFIQPGFTYGLYW
jgi:hypothetical protein